MSRLPRLSWTLGALVLAGGAWLSLAAGAATAATKVQTETITVAPPVASGPIVSPPAEERDLSALPERVRAMREKILDAIKTGEIESLRTVIESNELPPTFSIHEIADPIAYLKEQSGDGEGREILAILWDILESGWVKIGAGTPQEMYVWPFFAELPIDQLTPQQQVEAFRVVTSGDLEEMKAAGKYLFYKIGIGPDGTWHFFKVAD